MRPEEIYIERVLQRIPGAALRKQIELELRSHIADRLERGASVDETLRQLGDAVTLAESYLAAIPLVSAPHLRRLAAKLVDLSVVVLVPALMIVGALALQPVHLAPEWKVATTGGFAFPVILMCSMMLATFGGSLYMILAEYWTGQTIGKRLFGLRVVTEAGTRITLGQSVLRQFPLFLQIFLVDALFALFTKNHQRAFELITRTRLVLAQEASSAVSVAGT